jgi:hypothetical protein
MRHPGACLSWHPALLAVSSILTQPLHPSPAALGCCSPVIKLSSEDRLPLSSVPAEHMQKSKSAPRRLNTRAESILDVYEGQSSPTTTDTSSAASSTGDRCGQAQHVVELLDGGLPTGVGRMGRRLRSAGSRLGGKPGHLGC